MNVRSLVFCISLACIAPVNHATAYYVDASVLRAEYGGQTVLRCVLSPVNLSIRFIEWHDTSVDNDSPVYFDGDGMERNKARGRFIGRNVTGVFDNSKSYHNFIIKKSKTEDEGNYTCHVNARAETAWVKDQTQLKLLVSPHQPPEILDKRNKVQGRSNCTDNEHINAIAVNDKQQFFCRVGGSNPPAVISWNYAGYHRYHNTSYSREYERNERLVRDAKRQIDVEVEKESILKCTVRVPHEGVIVSTSLCLILRPIQPKRVLFWLIPIGIFSLVWLLAIVTFSVLHFYGRYNFKNQAQIAEHLFMVAICEASLFKQLFWGLLAVVYILKICPSVSQEWMDERATKITSTTVISTCFFINILLDILYLALLKFCQKDKMQPNLSWDSERPILDLTSWIVMHVNGPAFSFLVLSWVKYTKIINRNRKMLSKESQSPEHIALQQTGTSNDNDDTGTIVRDSPTRDMECTHRIGLPPAVVCACDLIMALAYLVGFIWNIQLLDECYWKSASFIWLLSFCCLGCTIWLVIGIVYIKNVHLEYKRGNS